MSSEQTRKRKSMESERMNEAMKRDLVDEKGCGGRFHIAVTATLVLLAKAMVVVRAEEKEGERKKGDGVLRVEFAMRASKSKASVPTLFFSDSELFRTCKCNVRLASLAAPF